MIIFPNRGAATMKIAEQDIIIYKYSKLLKLALDFTKLLNNNETCKDIYKFSTLVDSSPRKFDCTNAQSLKREILKKIKTEDIEDDLNIIEELLKIDDKYFDDEWRK